MYYYLNLKMNKGVGYMPTQEDIKSLPAEKQNIDYIKSCMVFNLNNDIFCVSCFVYHTEDP